ncbi:MAG: hypothetical protein WCV91_04745 [Candidatus Margulisiibacteriota bacterium]
MAKKKVKKIKKVKAKKPAKKIVKKVKVKKPVKKAVKKIASKKTKKVLKKKKIVAKKQLPVIKEKVLGRIEHCFDKIAVAALSVKNSFKVGDYVHIKGHTTDFIQKIESMQIEHESVSSVKKGDDVGLKVIQPVREHDMVYLATEKSLAAAPQKAVPVQQVNIQKPLFPSVAGDKPQGKPMPVIKPAPSAAPQSKSEPKKEGDPYSEKKFFNF